MWTRFISLVDSLFGLLVLRIVLFWSWWQRFSYSVDRKFLEEFSGSSPTVWISCSCILKFRKSQVDFKSFVLLSKPKWLVFSVLVFSVVSWYRDDFNFSYDRKCNLCKSSQVSMLGFELMKETVSNSGVSVLCFYASLTLGWEQLLFSCYLLWS